MQEPSLTSPQPVQSLRISTNAHTVVPDQELVWDSPAGDRQLWSVSYTSVMCGDESEMEALIEQARTANQVPHDTACMCILE